MCVWRREVREEVRQKETQRAEGCRGVGFSKSAGSDLVLQAAVLSLCVLPDDHDVNVLVPSLDSRD